MWSAITRVRFAMPIRSALLWRNDCSRKERIDFSIRNRDEQEKRNGK
jgi:hypothetical protein